MDSPEIIDQPDNMNALKLAPNENEFNILSIDHESFVKCLSSITGISVDAFVNDSSNSSPTWYESYIDTLKNNGYDMLFYSYRNEPMCFNAEGRIDHYVLPQLPMGQCVVLGVCGNFEVSSVVASSIDLNGEGNNSKSLIVTYDPNPAKKMVWAIEVAFFVQMFTNKVTINDSDG